MISGIDANNFITDTVIKLLGKNIIKNPPTENSILLLKVIEKTENGFKILINGDIFIAKLPLNVKLGEVMLGKVITSNPLVIGLDNFVQLKYIDQQFISALVEKLGLKQDKFNVDLVTKLVSGKKALLKSKIDDINEICEPDYSLTEMQIGMLINLLWSSSYSNRNEIANEIKIIKDIPFDKLCNEIFKSIIRLNNLNLSIELYNKIKECFFIDLTSNSYFSNNRLLDIINLIIFIDDYAERYKALKTESDELNLFNYKLIQYVLQKSIYCHFNFYPDFFIIINNKELDLIIFSVEVLNGSNGAKYYKTDIRCGKENEFVGAVNGYYTGKGFSGKVTIPNSINSFLKEKYSNLLNLLAHQTGLFLNISLEQGYLNSEMIYKLKSDLLNFKA